MKPENHPANAARRPDYRRIAEAVRRDILNGKFKPGDQLPSTRELATTWESSVFTIHNAVHTLVKEGWVERLGGSGTYVANFKNRFTCAGIYHSADIFANEDASFSRALHTCLLEQLHALKKETLVFLDTRPAKKQGKLLPALAEAILHRRVQCVIAPSVNRYSSPLLTRLSMPTSLVPNAALPNWVDVDRDELVRSSVAILARQGCRSVGILSSIRQEQQPPDPKNSWDGFYRTFEKAVKSHGLVTHPRWIRMPTTHQPNLELYGYREFKKFWALGDKPDGMIVYPDAVVRGVILAIGGIGLSLAKQMKFVFHRNARNRILCPFPATWAITDEAAVAAEYIKMIQKQFNGAMVSPVMVPHVYKSEKGQV